MLHEQKFSCPNCGEAITMVLDLSIPGQRYIEDCEVCCRPIEISYSIENSQVAAFSAQGSDE